MASQITPLGVVLAVLLSLAMNSAPRPIEPPEPPEPPAKTYTLYLPRC